MRPRLAATALVLTLSTPAIPTGAEEATTTQPLPALPQDAPDAGPSGDGVRVSGYVEVYGQWNANRPSNGITNFRGYDNRTDTFTLSDAVIDVVGTDDAVEAHVTLQVGPTAETYYLAEPVSPGSGAAGASDATTWKHLQQANVSYRAPVGRGLQLAAGLFLSPIGPEGLSVVDQWNWSRSNLFFALPAYHTGARLTYGLTDRLDASVLVCNGWNTVVDNNTGKSIAAQGTYTLPGRLTWNVVYFGGRERGPASPEGESWRHLLDSYVNWSPHPALSVMFHGDVGLEETSFGRSDWAAGAVYARVRVLPRVHLALRSDVFRERVAESPDGRAAAIFWPSDRVRSQTVTFDVQPRAAVSLRLEYRNDHAGDPMYFRHSVATDATGAFVPNAKVQDTWTAGMAVRF